MKPTLTDRLLDELNAKRGLKYPDVGYTYFADIKGDGFSKRSVWTIINRGGGVVRSHLNANNPRSRCNMIREEIAKA